MVSTCDRPSAGSQAGAAARARKGEGRLGVRTCDLRSGLETSAAAPLHLRRERLSFGSDFRISTIPRTTFVPGCVQCPDSLWGIPALTRTVIGCRIAEHAASHKCCCRLCRIVWLEPYRGNEPRNIINRMAFEDGRHCFGRQNRTSCYNRNTATVLPIREISACIPDAEPYWNGIGGSCKQGPARRASPSTLLISSGAA